MTFYRLLLNEALLSIESSFNAFKITCKLHKISFLKNKDHPPRQYFNFAIFFWSVPLLHRPLLAGFCPYSGSDRPSHGQTSYQTYPRSRKHRTFFQRFIWNWKWLVCEQGAGLLHWQNYLRRNSVIRFCKIYPFIKQQAQFHQV